MSFAFYHEKNNNHVIKHLISSHAVRRKRTKLCGRYPSTRRRQRPRLSSCLPWERVSIRVVSAGSWKRSLAVWHFFFLLLVVYSRYPGLEERCREFLHSSRVVTPVLRLNYRRLIASLYECLGACLCTHVCRNPAGS